MTTYRTCPSCKARVIYALTANRRHQMLDYQPAPEGDVAAYQDAAGCWHARTLTQAEHPYSYEHRHAAHYASSPQCRPPSAASKAAAAETVAFLADYRKAQASHNKTKRQRRGQRRAKPITGYRTDPGRKQ